MLRETLDALDPVVYKELMESFNNEETKIVKLLDNRFIAVHYTPQTGDQVLETRGCFTLGTHE